VDLHPIIVFVLGWAGFQKPGRNYLRQCGKNVQLEIAFSVAMLAKRGRGWARNDDFRATHRRDLLILGEMFVGHWRIKFVAISAGNV
jgi:hypothetical protein